MSFPTEHIDKFMSTPVDVLTDWCGAQVNLELAFRLEDAMGLKSEPTDPKMRAILTDELAGKTYRRREDLPEMLLALLEAAGI